MDECDNLELNSLPDVTPYTETALMTLDIDELPIEFFGHQGGSVYNGYADARIYSPLIVLVFGLGR